MFTFGDGRQAEYHDDDMRTYVTREYQRMAVLRYC